MRHLITVVALLTAWTVSTAAFAQTSAQLIRNVPSESQIVMGLEVPKLQKSFLYDELMTVLKDEASPSSVLGFVIASKAFDLEKDVKSMLIAMEKAPTNPQNPTTPASIVVVHGKLDRAKVKKVAESTLGELKTTKKGELEVWTTSGVSLAFTDDDTLLLADEGGFADKAWAAVVDEKASAAKNKTLTDLMSLTSTDRGLWVTVNTKGMPPAPGSPPMDGAAISLDVRTGVKADFRTQFEKPADAKAALEQFMQMKETSGQDPMVTMLGAKPLLDNLTAKVVKERVLAMKTSMTDTQVKQLLVRLKAMGQQPPPMAPGAQNPAPDQSPDQKTTPPPPPTGKGANADFN